MIANKISYFNIPTKNPVKPKQRANDRKLVHSRAVHIDRTPAITKETLVT